VLGGGVACGGGAANAPRSSGDKPAASASASAIASTSLGEPAGRALCARVCAIEARCGAEPASCARRCMPIARTLTLAVLARLVDCVESRAATISCDGDAARAARAKLVGECTLSAAATEGAAARTNVELFAKAYCDRNASCGVPGNSSGTCLGEAKGAILDTGGDSGISLYGALRPSALDELVLCLGAPCEKRATTADGELNRCLTELLTNAGADEAR
jgi:hypothetical protein